jgi:hypothetical protein
MPRVPDPALGKHVSIVIRNTVVGEFTGITQKHKINTTDYEPLGQGIAKTLEGSKKFEFDLEKGWIDVGVARLIWGQGGRFRRSDPTNVRAPRFTVVVTTDTPDTLTRETYFDVLIPNYESAAKGQSDMKTVKLDGCVADGGYDPGVAVPK